jgi:hypothetical protein
VYEYLTKQHDLMELLTTVLPSSGTTFPALVISAAYSLKEVSLNPRASTRRKAKAMKNAERRRYEEKNY